MDLDMNGSEHNLFCDCVPIKLLMMQFIIK